MDEIGTGAMIRSAPPSRMNGPHHIRKRRSRRTRRARAFTLIELLAVVAIILVLAGVLIAVAGHVSSKQKREQCRALIKTIELALEAYKADNGAYPPLDTDAFYGSTASLAGYVTNYYPNGARYGGRISVYYIGTTNYSLYPYPPPYSTPTNGWANSQFIYRALANIGNRSGKVYMNFPSDSLQTTHRQAGGAVVRVIPVGGTYSIVDPWGMPLGYNPTEPRANVGSFDLWSAGPDTLCSNAFYYEGWAGGTVLDDDIGNWASR